MGFSSRFGFIKATVSHTLGAAESTASLFIMDLKGLRSGLSEVHTMNLSSHLHLSDAVHLPPAFEFRLLWTKGITRNAGKVQDLACCTHIDLTLVTGHTDFSDCFRVVQTSIKSAGSEMVMGPEK